MRQAPGGNVAPLRRGLRRVKFPPLLPLSEEHLTIRFAELVLLNLAGSTERQRIHEHHSVGDLPRGDPAIIVFKKLYLAQIIVRPHDNENRTLVPFGVTGGNRGSLRHLGVGHRDVFEFQVPIGAQRVDMSLNVPPRRVDAGSAGYTGYALEVGDLPWGEGRHKVVRYRADADHKGEVIGSEEGEGASVTIENSLCAPGVELIEITRLPS